MKTREEIEALKRNWKADPIWDIETTEGFEDHKDELLQFSKECIKTWSDRSEARLKAYCEDKGFDYPHQSKLAINFRNMEDHIQKLDDLIYELRNR